MIRLGRDDARRVSVAAALLGRARPGSIADAVGRLAGVRVETTVHVAASAEHILHSRLGPASRPADVATALARGELFERDWILHPIDELPLFLAGAESWPDRSGTRGWMEANAPFARGILERIGAEGPLTSREIPDEAIAPWPSSGWNDNRNVARMLDCLHMTGELAVIAHAGRFRVFDLVERVLPAGVAPLPEPEARRIRADRLLASLGVARRQRTHAFDTTGLGEELQIDGAPGRWRVDPAALELDRSTRTAAILSPFDRLMSDRHRVAHVFDFDYTLEMYKPEAARRRGYFALPVLLGDRLAGSIDARTDRDAGELRVDRVHEDDAWSADERDAVRAELVDLAGFLGVGLRMPD